MRNRAAAGFPRAGALTGPASSSAAVDSVDSANRRVASEHVLGAAVHEHVDFKMRRAVLEHAEHRRGQQHALWPSDCVC